MEQLLSLLRECFSLSHTHTHTHTFTLSLSLFPSLMVECRSLHFAATKCRSLGAALPHVTPLPWNICRRGQLLFSWAGEKTSLDISYTKSKHQNKLNMIGPFLELVSKSRIKRFEVVY